MRAFFGFYIILKFKTVQTQLTLICLIWLKIINGIDVVIQNSPFFLIPKKK